MGANSQPMRISYVVPNDVLIREERPLIGWFDEVRPLPFSFSPSLSLSLSPLPSLSLFLCLLSTFLTQSF